jgi:aromatic ring-opening dioxygenase LigB subunit
MIIAAPKTGVTKANIRIVKNNAIVINGNKTRLFLKPGILKVLLVISKFVNEIVVLTPAKITDKTAIS